MPLLAKRYQFIEILKKSNFSTILKVKDTFIRNDDGDGKKVVKMYHLSRRARGIREANRLMRLNQENMNESMAMVRLECTFSYRGHFCLLLEWLSSKSPILYREPSGTHLESIQTLRKIGFQLIVALHILHRCSLIYGNLRPGHVLLTKEDGESNME
jgi:serine/threonine protein kinase